MSGDPGPNRVVGGRGLLPNQDHRPLVRGSGNGGPGRLPVREGFN